MARWSCCHSTSVSRCRWRCFLSIWGDTDSFLDQLRWIPHAFFFFYLILAVSVEFLMWCCVVLFHLQMMATVKGRCATILKIGQNFNKFLWKYLWENHRFSCHTWNVMRWWLVLIKFGKIAQMQFDTSYFSYSYRPTVWSLKIRGWDFMCPLNVTFAGNASKSDLVLSDRSWLEF